MSRREREKVFCYRLGLAYFRSHLEVLERIDSSVKECGSARRQIRFFRQKLAHLSWKHGRALQV